MKFLEIVKDFIFPKKCLGCSRWGEYLCENCINYIKVCEKGICPFCQKPSLYGLTHPVCWRPRGLNGLTSVFSYLGSVKNAVIRLKYRFATDLADTILELFLSFCGEDKAFCKFVSQKNVFLVPVPLHWQRKNWRGFNQAELLGKMIAQKLGIGFLPDLLVRTRYTTPQTKLKKEKRRQNIRGAFRLNKEAFSDILNLKSNILIFDDVWTTGATLKECTWVLKNNGAKTVWGLTLAR